MITTTHIRHMLEEATRLAELVDGQPDDVTVNTGTAERPHFLPGGDEWPTGPIVLERAANLAAHAAEESRDEMLRARDGWPFV